MTGKYIHHTENVIDIGPSPLPNVWKNISGLNGLSDAELKPLGWLPVVDVGSAGPFMAAPTGANVGDPVTPGANSVTRTYAYKSLADCVAIKSSQINALRASKRYPGTVAIGLGWNVDLRNTKDESNITGKALLAAIQKINVDATPITFMGADNVARDLTPDEMIAVGMAVDAYVSGIYAQSWVHKGTVASLATVAEVEAYDIGEGW